MSSSVSALAPWLHVKVKSSLNYQVKICHHWSGKCILPILKDHLQKVDSCAEIISSLFHSAWFYGIVCQYHIDLELVWSNRHKISIFPELDLLLIIHSQPWLQVFCFARQRSLENSLAVKCNVQKMNMWTFACQEMTANAHPLQMIITIIIKDINICNKGIGGWQCLNISQCCHTINACRCEVHHTTFTYVIQNPIVARICLSWST